MSGLKDLYRDSIRRHASEPVGFRKSFEPTHRCEGHNPQCGDRVEIAMRLADDIIEDITFDGEACAICMASASIMCEQLGGLTLAQFGTLKKSLVTALADREEPDDIGPLSPLLGVRPYPSRIQCAILPWHTAEKASIPEN